MDTQSQAEVPSIEHPPSCGCSSCQFVPQSSYDGYISAQRKRIARMHIAQESVSKASDVFLFWLFIILIGLLLSFALINYVYKNQSAQVEECKFSTFYQDLNKVEITQCNGNEISPKLIAAIHHFQEAPFGMTVGHHFRVIFEGFFSLVYLVCMILLLAFAVGVLFILTYGST